jgi:ubiquinone/menaquinone biosynthesis C-methylase UbiE
VGCGAGVSTKALEDFANHSIGLEPVEAMLEWSRLAAPRASFLAGAAEALPIEAGSIDLITAAGSLNYVDLARFFEEAARVLAGEGRLLVYDFEPGRSLDAWFSGFTARYPSPPHEGRVLDPEILAEHASGFKLDGEERFEIGMTLDVDFYAEYMMTETNVAFAVGKGVSREEIRSWCAETLAPFWGQSEREVVFRGYYAWLAR